MSLYEGTKKQSLHGDMKGVLIYPLFFTEIDKNEKIHVSLFRTKTETFIHTEDEEEEEFSDQQVKDHVP